MLCAALPYCPDALAATTTEAVGKLLGFATQHGGAGLCRFVEESGAGVAGAGCDGAESAADAVSAAPHRRGAVWWCGVAMIVGSAPENAMEVSLWGTN